MLEVSMHDRAKGDVLDAAYAAKLSVAGYVGFRLNVKLDSPVLCTSQLQPCLEGLTPLYQTPPIPPWPPPNHLTHGMQATPKWNPA